MKLYCYIIIAALGLAACSGSHSNSDVSIPATSKSIASHSAEASPPPRGARATTRLALPLHPGNAGATVPTLSPTFFTKRLGLDRGNNRVLNIDKVTLKRWGDTETARAGVMDPQIDPNRLVYEVVTKFDQPYGIRGNIWSSGKRIYIVDAVTGEVYLSRTIGNMTQSEVQVRAHLKPMPLHIIKH